MVPTTEGKSYVLQRDILPSHIPTFRINWTGSALTTFYAAVRKALVVVIVVRAIFVLLGLLLGGWLLFKR